MAKPGVTAHGRSEPGVSPPKILTGGTKPGRASPRRSPRLRSSGQQTATKWLRFTGRRPPATAQILATGTEPLQVSGLPVAHIRWHRTEWLKMQVSRGTAGSPAGEARGSPAVVLRARLAWPHTSMDPEDGPGLSDGFWARPRRGWRWAVAEPSSVGAGEAAEVGEAPVIGDVGDRAVGLGQILTGPVQAHLAQVAHRRGSVLFVEGVVQATCAGPGEAGQVGYSVAAVGGPLDFLDDPVDRGSRGALGRGRKGRLPCVGVLLGDAAGRRSGQRSSDSRWRSSAGTAGASAD